eukprot:TRINITY_DN2166_c0_g1_i1.p2 TRINITY_DN2166_c0_g1~~TRINITY_DN2166_c0_g1_i1.p2  ORF type:complete len:118 (-),score=12.21 TRINITY_DN2166_c0_g1_i1:196-549(-)
MTKQLQVEITSNISQGIQNFQKTIFKDNKISFSSMFQTIIKWFLFLLNEPSLGLYYIQQHFKDSLSMILEEQKTIAKEQKKLEIANDQIARTIEEMQEIANLNSRWVSQMSLLLDQL